MTHFTTTSIGVAPSTAEQSIDGRQFAPITYRVPSETTASEVAAHLGVSAKTFDKHSSLPNWAHAEVELHPNGTIRVFRDGKELMVTHAVRLDPRLQSHLTHTRKAANDALAKIAA